MKHATTLHSVRHAMCCGKVKYSWRGPGEEFIARSNKKYQVEKQAYYCPFCNHYHVGGKPKAKTVSAISNIKRMLIFDYGEACECAKQPEGK